MKKKSVALYRNTPLMLSVGLCFLMPGNTVRALLILCIAFILSVQRKISFCLNEIFSIGVLRWIYVLTVVSSFIIHYYSSSLINMIDFVVAFFLGRHIIISVIKNRKSFDSFINVLLFLFFLYTIMGFIEAFTQFNIFDIITGREIVLVAANSMRNGFFRSHGFCLISINNGVIMSMIWCVAAYKLFNKINAWNLLLYLSFGAYTLVIFSRLVIIVALLSQFLLLQSIRKTGKFKVLLTIIAIIAIFFLLPGASAILDRFLSSFIPLIEELRNFSSNTTGIYSGGTGERRALWGWVYDSIRDNLIFGVGFSKPFSYNYWFVDRYYLKESIENQWLWTLYRTGLYGLVGFITYQTYCLKSAFELTSYKGKSKKRHKYDTLQNEKLSFSTCMRVIVMGYILCIFGVASFEDLIVFYFLYALYEAYIKLLSRESLIYE